MDDVLDRVTCAFRLLVVVAGMAACTPAALAQSDAEKNPPLRYLKLADGKYVLESQVAGTRSDDKLIYVSRTERGPEKMTLTLTYEKANVLTRAEATLESGSNKHTAVVVFDKNGAQLKRPGG